MSESTSGDIGELITVSAAAKLLGANSPKGKISNQCVFDLIRRNKLGEAKYFQSPNPKQRLTMVSRKAVEDRIEALKKK